MPPESLPADLAGRVAALSPQRQALLERMRQQRGAAAGIPRRAAGGQPPLSFAQQRMWFLDQFEPQSPAYTIYETVRARGSLDVAALQRAVERLCRRHDVLRSAYPVRDGHVIQVISEQVPELVVEDLTAVPQADREAAALDRAAQEARRPFGLATGWLLRGLLLRLASDDHLLILTVHHIVSDGWSMGVVIKELIALYQAETSGQPDPLPALPIQYGDFAAWQRARLTGPVLASELAYWREALAGAPTLLELPTDRPRPARPSSQGAVVGFRLDRELVAAVAGLARQDGVTPFMALLAAFCILLSRYSGRADICVGTPIANRLRPETEDLIGFFVNTLALRVDLAGEPSFRHVLQRVREVTLNAFEHQELPFERLVEELRPERDAAHTPLFQVMFILQNTPAPPLRSPDLALDLIPLHNGTAKFDLTLNLLEEPDGITGSFEYATDLFDEATVVRLAGHYQNLLREAVRDPDRPLWKVAVLGEADRRQLVNGWNETARNWAVDDLVPQLIAEQARRTPDAVAVVSAGASLTYREVDHRAGELAHRLRRLGVGPDRVVGVCLERSAELAVSLLAVLKAGAAYLPLDTRYPAERLDFMARDAGVVAVITRPDGSHWPVPAVSPEWTGASSQPASGVPVRLAGANLAYVIYTSGSTGTPKAVMSTHEGLLNRLLWMQDTYRLTPADRVLHKTPFSFDVSVWELFWPLITGARLVVAEPEAHHDPTRLVDIVHAEEVTIVHFVPSMMRAFLDEPRVGTCASLRTVISSGEALPSSLASRFAGLLPAAELHNLYGPTEASIDVTAYRFESDSARGGATVPIGRPIANTAIRILDGRLNPVPVGVAGEIYIAGIGLARGYLNRPELTAERFLPDPFCQVPGSRLYRTGDRARYLPDGNIEYLDRTDRQVKIRGFRIEPGEIESALRLHPEVSAAAVVAWPGSDDQSARLVGYAVPVPGAQWMIPELLGFLRQRLPEHHVPSAILILPELPLTSSGKLDRRALPPPGAERPDVGEYQAPENDDEEMLADVWATVLGLDRIGVEDNFFALGGDSIRSIQVLSMAHHRGFAVTLPQIFEHPTVRALVASMRDGTSTRLPGQLPPAQPFGLVAEPDRNRMPPDIEDAYPLSALQAGMIFDNEISGDFSIYHDVFSFTLRVRFDGTALEQAAARLAARHPVLRTSIDLHSYREPLQLVHRTGMIPVTVDDLRSQPAERRQAVIAKWLEREQRRRFAWDQPSHLRLHIHLRDEETFQASLSCSNVILDGWSVAIMLTELCRTYAALLADVPVPDGGVSRNSFRRFIELERFAVDSAECRSYWERALREVTTAALPRWPVPPHGADSPDPAGGRMRRVREVPIDKEVDEGLRRLARTVGVPLKSVLFAAHLYVIRTLAGVATPATGLVTNGRPEEPGSEHALGLFLNVVPAVAGHTGRTWAELARQAFETERELLPHRRYPTIRMRAGEVGALRLETAFNFVRFHVYQMLDGIDGLDVLDSTTFDDTNFTLWAEFSVHPRTARAKLELLYDAAELPTAQIDAIAGWYARVLAAIAGDPEGGPGALSQVAITDLDNDWDGAEVPVPAGWSVLALFERQAAASPDATAFASADQRITYAELDRRANRLAHLLRELGVGREVPVGVCLERSIDLPVTLLAVFKAGGAYVPLDPAYPADRLALMLADVDVAVLVTTGRLADALSARRARVVAIDVVAASIAERPATGIPVEAAPDNLAYIIFTSGSTGRPKGVAVEHRQILNRLAWMWQEYPFAGGEVCAQKTSLNFVDSLWELLGPLLRGVPTVIVPDDAVRDASQLVRVLREHQVTRLWLVPGLLRTLLTSFEDLSAELPKLRFWVTSGEPLATDLLRLFESRMPGGALFNLYGTSEVWDATWFDPRGKAIPPSGVPIGRPIWNVRCYVLDGERRPVPVGVPGELYVAGDGLARGYLNSPELTAESFVPSPFASQPGGRLYRTGDLACRLPGGDILLLGRVDRQLKIRGFRVEPSELEARLREHPAVRDAVVTGYRRGADGETALAAYLVPEPGQEIVAEEVSRYARDCLPAHLRPARFVPLARVPLTPSGKVDRLALPPVDAEPSGATDVPPSTPVEEVLCALCAEVLGHDRVGVHDNFFELGGDSLLAMAIVARVRHAFGVMLPVSALFSAPTVAGLAKQLPAEPAQAPAGGPVRAVADNRSAGVPASFAQRRLWFAAQLDPDDASYNVPVAARLSGALNVEALKACVSEIIRRHEVLRTTYLLVDGEPVQQVRDDLGPELTEVDFSAVAAEEIDERLRATVTAEVRRRFDLSRGPLVRALLVRLDAQQHLAVITAHHIACDAWSMEILAGELSALYPALCAGQPSPLPELPVQYADFALWQRGQLRGAALERLLEYWRQRLTGAPTGPDLTLGAHRPPRLARQGATTVLELPTALRDAVKGMSARHGATLFMGLLAAFTVILRNRAGTDDVVVGTDVAGRDDPALERLIGFFVNQLALRVDLSGNPSFAELLQRVRDVTLDAYAHREAPFDQVVEALQPARHDARAPLFQVKLVLQNVPEQPLHLSGVTAAPYQLDRGTAQLDLNVRCAETVSGLVLSAEHDRDLLPVPAVELMLALFRSLLERVVSTPEITLAELDALLAEQARRHTEEERAQLSQAMMRRLRTARRSPAESPRMSASPGPGLSAAGSAATSQPSEESY